MKPSQFSVGDIHQEGKREFLYKEYIKVVSRVLQRCAMPLSLNQFHSYSLNLLYKSHLKLPLPMSCFTPPPAHRCPPSGSESTAYANSQLSGDLSVRTDPVFSSKSCASFFPLNCEFSSSKHPRQCIPECRNYINNYYIFKGSNKYVM